MKYNFDYRKQRIFALNSKTQFKARLYFFMGISLSGSALWSISLVYPYGFLGLVFIYSCVFVWGCVWIFCSCKRLIAVKIINEKLNKATGEDDLEELGDNYVSKWLKDKFKQKIAEFKITSKLVLLVLCVISGLIGFHMDHKYTFKNINNFLSKEPKSKISVLWSDYVNNCIRPDVVMQHKYTLQELVKTKNVLLFLDSKSASLIRGVFIDGEFQTCHHSFLEFKSELDNLGYALPFFIKFLNEVKHRE